MADRTPSPIPWGTKDPELAYGVCELIKRTMRSEEVGYWYPVGYPETRLIRRIVIGCAIFVVVATLYGIALAIRGGA